MTLLHCCDRGLRLVFDGFSFEREISLIRYHLFLPFLRLLRRLPIHLDLRIHRRLDLHLIHRLGHTSCDVSYAFCYDDDASCGQGWFNLSLSCSQLHELRSHHYKREELCSLMVRHHYHLLVLCFLDRLVGALASSNQLLVHRSIRCIQVTLVVLLDPRFHLDQQELDQDPLLHLVCDDFSYAYESFYDVSYAYGLVQKKQQLLEDRLEHMAYQHIFLDNGLNKRSPILQFRLIHHIEEERLFGQQLRLEVQLGHKEFLQVFLDNYL